MRRPNVRRQQPGIALFPFLAVLICTMGSLIVLLVLVVQQAKASAAAPAEALQAENSVDAEKNKQLIELEEELQWRADMLQEQREAYSTDLTNKKAELAHLEDHIRRLEDQAKQLMAQADELEKTGKGKLADRDSVQQQLAEMEAEIETKRKELDEARKAVLRRRPAYAIIPYDGPNGTSRRPMYIECTEGGIVLQPEGVLLTADDFQGPLGPGNPLDAALRATREHLKRSGLQTEPYPLIIVRPNGAIAFGACRSAMKHWESEFGYELVDQEAEIKYPPPDSQLASTLQRAVKDARLRQQALVAAMPQRFTGSAGRSASFRPEDNLTFDDGDGGGGTAAGPRGSARNSGVPNSGVPSVATGGSGNGTGPRGATGSGGSGTSGTGALGGTGQRSQPGTAAPRYAANGSVAGQSGTGGSASNPNTQPNTSGPSGQNGAASGGTSYAGGSPGGGAPSGANSAQGAGATSMNSSGASSGSPGAMNSAGGASSGASGNSSSSASQQSESSGQPSPAMNFSAQDQAKKAKARKAVKNRGENWGLPNSSAKATAVTRPIRVQCFADELRLMPEQGDLRTPLIVPIEGELMQNLDGFIDSLWRHMDRWGVAVLGGYWKPVLVVEVKPGGEERFAELTEQLRGSGIEVERKP